MRYPIILTVLVALLAPGAASAQIDISDEVFYHFMPITWRDSDNDTWRFGDFDGMTASLPYLEDLGITAIWMNPIHPSPAYHGYQHGPGDSLNTWFGTEADFTNFVQQAHARNIKVFIDYVAYGINRSSVYFQDAYNNPSSPYDTWLAFTNSANTTYFGFDFTTWNGDTIAFINWDLTDPAPRALITGWLQKWLDPNTDGFFDDGIDGYRFDHVWVTYPPGYGYDIDTFWAPMRTALRSVNPDVFVFAEQADWSIHGQELFVGMDGAFTKPFESAARSALTSESSAPLRGEMPATLAALDAAPAPGTFLATIGNHDVDRITSVIGGSLDKAKAAAAVLMTQPFPPIIYSGDEIGMLGVKNNGLAGDAKDIPYREPFKWNAVAGPPMSNYYALNAAAYSARYSMDNDGRSVEEQLGVPTSLLEAHRDLIAARHGSAALRHGDYTEIPNAEDAVWTFLRSDSTQQVLVAINLSGSTASDTLDLTGFTIAGGSTMPVDLIGSATPAAITTANQGAYPLSLPAYGYRLLEVAMDPPPPGFDPVNGSDIQSDHFPGLRAVQDNATGLGDNASELDRLFVRCEPDRLYIGIPGNLAVDGTGLSLLVDAGTGGQNVLDLSDVTPPPNGPAQLTGMVLDAGFVPDQLLYINAFGGAIYVDQYELLTAGGTNKTYRGQGTVGSGTGLLSGGTNLNDLRVALDNSNTAGVTDIGASAAATADTGFEIVLPFADIGFAGTGTLRLAVFLNETSGAVSNQWLPGLGGGYGNLGLAPDLTAVPGPQYVEFAVPCAVTGVPEASPATDLRASYPAGRAGSPVRIDFRLDEPETVTLSVFDVQGRLVRRLAEGPLPAGAHTYTWRGESTGGKAATGIYYIRLRTESRDEAVQIRRLP